MRALRLMWLGLAACCLSGCNATQPLISRQIVGLLPNDPTLALEMVSVPANAPANQPLTLIVTTYGSSSCITPDGAKVEVSGLNAKITPLDRVPRGDVACTADLAAHPRPVTLVFTEPGAAVIRIVGQGFVGEPTSFERRLTITE